MNLAGVDLNLLVAFEALLIEQNVSRAAERIGLAQPSMSNALTRLRRLFHDELFVRTPQGMQPTPRALELAEPLSIALAEIRKALDPGPHFDPATAERTFTLAGSDYVEFSLLPMVMDCFRREGPGLNLCMRSFERDQVFHQIDTGEIECGIGVFSEIPKRMAALPLLQERFVCIARRSHPALQSGLDLSTFIRQPQILFSLRGDPKGVVDQYLAKQGLKRRVALTVSHFLVLPFIVAQSDLIATVAERVALTLQGVSEIEIYPMPLDLPPWQLHLVWGRGAEFDPAQIWLRQTLVRCCRGLRQANVATEDRGC